MFSFLQLSLKKQNNNWKNYYNIPYYELITTDIQKDGKNIHALLVKKYGKKITVKEFVPFYTFMDRRIEFYHNNNLFLILYGNNDRCIVHNYSEKKKIYFGTYNLVMMYLYFEYYYAFINRNKKNTNLFNVLISKFFNLRNTYLNNKNITVVDESPFMDFTYKCHGIPIDPIRASRLAGAEKKKQGKKILDCLFFNLKHCFNNPKKIKIIQKNL